MLLKLVFFFALGCFCRPFLVVLQYFFALAFEGMDSSCRR